MLQRNLLNRKFQSFITTTFLPKAHFSYSISLHKQWLKTIQDKIIRNNIDSSDLQHIDERIINIDDLKNLCHTVALNTQTPSLIELLSNKISNSSAIILQDPQYKNKKSSFLAILESFTLIRGYECHENTVNECQKHCFQFLENKEKEAGIKTSNYNEVGHICRIFASFLKQNKKIDEQLIDLVVCQIDEMINDKSLVLDFVILMKYLEFIEEIKLKENGKSSVKDLSKEIKRQLQEKLEKADSHFEVTAEDLLMLNDGIFYFMDNPKFIDLLLQELTLAGLLGTEATVSSNFTMDRVLGDFSQMLLNLEYDEKIIEDKILDKLYEYLVFLMRNSNKFKGDTRFAKNLPNLWFKYVYTVPSKTTLAQVEQQFSVYVENFLRFASEEKKDLAFGLIESFLTGYDKFLSEIPNFKRKEFFDAIQINPGWFMNAIFEYFSIDDLNVLSSDAFLAFANLFHFTETTGKARVFLADEAIRRIQLAEKSYDFTLKNRILKSMAQINFLKIRSLENLNKAYNYKDEIGNSIIAPKKARFIDFLYITSFGGRHNEFLSLLQVFRKSISSGILTSEDFAHIFILCLEQGIYDDEIINKNCLINLQSSLNNLPLTRKIELMCLLQRFLDYFDEKFSSYCEKIFQTTFRALLNEDLKKNNILVIYAGYLLALYPRNNDLFMKYLLKEGEEKKELSEKIQFYAFVFMNYLKKFPDIEYFKTFNNQAWLITKSQKWIELKGANIEEIELLRAMVKKPPETDKAYWKPVKKNFVINFNELHNRNKGEVVQM